MCLTPLFWGTQSKLLTLLYIYAVKFTFIYVLVAENQSKDRHTEQ